jgi:hypothetical protein
MVNGRPETNRYARIENSMACSTASWLANIAHPRHLVEEEARDNSCPIIAQQKSKKPDQ